MLRALFAVTIFSGGLLPSFAAEPGSGAPPTDALSELHRSFTLGGAPVPPLVFRDLGDGNPADKKPMLVTVDAWAAIGSNQYAVPITRHGDQVSQTADPDTPGGATETVDYRYVGATESGLMVVIAVDSTSEGTYAPVALHVLDASETRAFDADGASYRRIEVTTLWNRPLGDRWNGRTMLVGDTLTVTSDAAAGGRPDTARLRITRP